MNTIERDEWTKEALALHYWDVLDSPPNGWGQHVSQYFGQSHMILIAGHEMFGAEEFDEEVDKAKKERG